MKKLKPANKRFYIVLAVIGALIISWLIWGLFGPKPLGDGLKLVNRTHSGYLPFISDSPFSTDYYYATDMSLDEFTTYFKNAKLVEPPSTELDAYQVRFINHTNQGFTLLFYYHDKATAKTSLAPGKNLVIVPDRHYEAAQNSL